MAGRGGPGARPGTLELTVGMHGESSCLTGCRNARASANRVLLSDGSYGTEGRVDR